MNNQVCRHFFVFVSLTFRPILFMGVNTSSTLFPAFSQVASLSALGFTSSLPYFHHFLSSSLVFCFVLFCFPTPKRLHKVPGCMVVRVSDCSVNNMEKRRVGGGPGNPVCSSLRGRSVPETPSENIWGYTQLQREWFVKEGQSPFISGETVVFIIAELQVRPLLLACCAFPAALHIQGKSPQCKGENPAGRASLMAQSPPADPWVGTIPWRK